MALSSNLVTNAALPTLYEYYTEGGIKSGLNADNSYFTLNGRNITLYSGAMHYFRTPKELWRDRLRKMRAAGLNAVETYVAWNLHEPSPGQFDFGHGGSDMEDFLDVETFLKTAQEEDLLAILRPGPYICAEWEFGGLPSWLLRDKDIKFRTTDKTYMEPLTRFFNALLPILAALQFINGGPIISFQVENEYASTQRDSFDKDKEYLGAIRQMYLDNNISALLTTTDAVNNLNADRTLPDSFLMTTDFGLTENTKKSLDALEKVQPGRPKMAMEFYPGWFDLWGVEHQTRNPENVINSLKEIISYPASFNMYMFQGGTSFGFLNGAVSGTNLPDSSGFSSDITSYDYDGPITEAGDYTQKYDMIKSLLSTTASPQTRLPDKPELIPRTAYPNVSIVDHVSLKSLLDSQSIKLEYDTPIAMELLDINNGSGQSFGYITYRKENLNLAAKAVLTISGHVYDSVLVLVNGKLISPPLKKSADLNSFGFYRLKDSQITLTDSDLTNATLDLVVENWGRVTNVMVNQHLQFKGLWTGDVLIDNEVVSKWQHIPLEFKKVQNLNFEGWQAVGKSIEPGLYRGYLNIEGTPTDTYVDMRPWTKGIVIINGFVLGRYARIGPQQCLYLPAPLIKQGKNEIVIFEHYEASDTVAFSADQIWEML